jgi:hypothetical protein
MAREAVVHSRRIKAALLLRGYANTTTASSKLHPSLAAKLSHPLHVPPAISPARVSNGPYPPRARAKSKPDTCAVFLLALGLESQIIPG